MPPVRRWVDAGQPGQAGKLPGQARNVPLRGELLSMTDHLRRVSDRSKMDLLIQVPGYPAGPDHAPPLGLLQPHLGLDHDFPFAAASPQVPAVGGLASLKARAAVPDA
jgi:hypothetical protein